MDSWVGVLGSNWMGVVLIGWGGVVGMGVDLFFFV